MASLVQCMNSGKRFRLKPTKLDGESGVWLKMWDGDDEHPPWPIYDDCHTLMKSYQTFTVVQIFDDKWEIDNG